MLRTGSRRLRLLAAMTLVVVLAGGAVATAALRRFDRPARSAVGALRLDPPATAALPPEYAGVIGVVDLVNAERTRQGLPALQWHDQVAGAALAHSSDMAAHSFMLHAGSDGSDTGDRLARAGFATGQWGETIAAGQRQVRALYDAWMASPPHRQILLGPFEYVGVAAVADASGTPYWTLVTASA